MHPDWVDAWMDNPGAKVVGHRASVRAADTGLRVECSCGHITPVSQEESNACLMLVMHLEAAVRKGAPVVRGDDDGLAGVCEPRRPLPPNHELSAARDIA